VNKKYTEVVTAAIIKWIGSVQSLALHTVLFVLNFSLYWFGVSFNTILLVLTTAVSIEAIYLAILMQMSLNIQSEKLDEMNDEDHKEHKEHDTDTDTCEHCGAVIDEDDDKTK